MFRKYLIFLSLKMGEFYLIVGMNSHFNETWKSSLRSCLIPHHGDIYSLLILKRDKNQRGKELLNKKNSKKSDIFEI